MDHKTMNSSTSTVPLYTKIGWGIAWLVMLGFAAMILRNCATSVIYGLKTDPQTIESSYQAGAKDGRAGQGQDLRGEAVENSVLRKAYVKGYRDGIDKERGLEKQQE
jgi:hypothetical protein